MRYHTVRWANEAPCQAECGLAISLSSTKRTHDLRRGGVLLPIYCTYQTAAMLHASQTGNSLHYLRESLAAKRAEVLILFRNAANISPTRGICAVEILHAQASVHCFQASRVRQNAEQMHLHGILHFPAEHCSLHIPQAVYPLELERDLPKQTLFALASTLILRSRRSHKFTGQLSNPSNISLACPTPQQSDLMGLNSLAGRATVS